MANYNIELTRTAEKSLRTIPKRDVQRLVAAIDMLALTPYPNGSRKLSGFSNVFRVRVGQYRIVYEVIELTITILILKIGHRKDIYR